MGTGHGRSDRRSGCDLFSSFSLGPHCQMDERNGAPSPGSYLCLRNDTNRDLSSLSSSLSKRTGGVPHKTQYSRTLASQSVLAGVLRTAIESKQREACNQIS